MRDVLIPFDADRPAIPLFGVTADRLADRLMALPAQAKAWVDANAFSARAGTALVVPGSEGKPCAVLLGVDPGDRQSDFVVASLAAKLPAGDYRIAEGFSNPGEVALAFALASYRFDTYKTSEPKQIARLMAAGDLEEIRIVLDGVQLVRDLINTPANDLGPEELTDAAETLFCNYNGTSEISIGEALVGRGFPLVRAVGAASERAPRLVDCVWGDAAHPKVTLVGKGVIFDTGGLDIKPSSSMLLMKKDMGGAANVLGLASMIMASRLPVRLRVIIPAVENSIGGSAFRPGDIFTSRKGLTVEIGNTDAEGRLILADAIALADEDHPDLLIDMATLTGAARVALGPDLPPFYTHSDEFAADIAASAETSNDPLWRMPLWRPYSKYLESQVADINNVNTSGAGFAGSITAALFLSRFVENAKTWAHFDIFGWTPAERPGRPVGGEAQAIRALFWFLKNKYGK